MQKKLIALAVAGLVSGGAFAQSNVSIYGVVDAAYLHLASSGKTSQNMIESGGMNGSRLGFKGEEALGNGLKAIFTLEYNLGIDANSGIGDQNSTNIGAATSSAAANATGGLSATGGTRWTSSQSRQTFVGLTGNFGTVVAGRLQSAGLYWAIDYLPFSGGGFSNDNLYSSFLQAGSTGRFSNAAGYVSPTFGGVTLEWDHARLTEDANHFYNLAAADAGVRGDSTANELSAKYANGPLKAQLIYAKVSASYTAAADDIKEMGLGVSYDFGVAKVMGVYKDRRQDNLSASGKNKLYALSASAPVGSGAIIASYARSTLDNNNVANDRGTGLGLQYRHFLSKRTTAYVGYTRISNDSGGSASVTTSAGLAPTVGGNASITGLGVNHAF